MAVKTETHCLIRRAPVKVIYSCDRRSRSHFGAPCTRWDCLYRTGRMSVCLAVTPRRPWTRPLNQKSDITMIPGSPRRWEMEHMTERDARFLPGIRMLVVGIVIVIGGAALAWYAARFSGATAFWLAVLYVLVLLAGVSVLAGLTPVVPGRARVVQLFGKYRGTIRAQGLQWVNPLTKRIAVSTRIRNLESAQLKVNDAAGNPIEIAAVVVWQVGDTASATYAIDEVTKFVTIQTETAVRHVASSYPYD